MADLSYDEVSRLLKPDFEAGKLYWLPRTPDMFSCVEQDAEHACKIWNARFAGKEAFVTGNGRGYFTASLFGRRYTAHRVLWLLHTSSWPVEQIDHINGVRSDNRIVNLREATNAENGRNQRLHVTNRSGCPGVSWHSTNRAWQAKIRFDNKHRHIGYFQTKDAAIAARKAAEREFGFHPNHGG